MRRAAATSTAEMAAALALAPQASHTGAPGGSDRGRGPGDAVVVGVDREARDQAGGRCEDCGEYRAAHRRAS